MAESILLTDLSPSYLRLRSARTWVRTHNLADADGIIMLCPRCVIRHGRRRTHSVICWAPHVRHDVRPSGGRWRMEGTGMGTMTLVSGRSVASVQVAGCGAHFTVRDGRVELHA